MRVSVLALVFLAFACSSFGQIADSASAVMSFNSTLEESISGIVPEVWSSSSYSFVEDRFGEAESAVQLSAQLDYGDPDFSRMGSSDFSIAYWFRKDGSLWQEDPVLEKKYFLISGPDDIVYEEYGMHYNDWIGLGSFQIRFKPFTDSSGVPSSLGPLTENIWHHIAVTFDRSDSMRSYLNGELIQSRSISHVEQYQANVDSAHLMVGNGNISLDDLYFFQQALSDEEVLELYSGNPTVGIEAERSAVAGSVFPNPSEGEFVARFSTNDYSIVDVSVTTLAGKSVPISHDANRSGEITIRVPTDSKGVFMLLVTFEDGVYTERIQIE